MSAPVLSVMPTLDELAADPSQVMDLDPAEVAAVLAKAEGLAAVARARLARATGERGREPELLTARQVGERLGLTERQIYRRADRWPFTRRLGPKTLRFDPAGLASYFGRGDRA